MDRVCNISSVVNVNQLIDGQYGAEHEEVGLKSYKPGGFYF